MLTLGRRRPGAGFTFIELLVVVFLMGLLFSLALLSMRGQSDGERLQREAERLLARMTLAREEAVLQVRTLGLRVEPGGYRFLQLRDRRWQSLSDDRLLPEHELPALMDIAVELEGIEISVADLEDSEESREPPQVFFLATGEIEPSFELQLRSDAVASRYTIARGEEEWLVLSDGEQ